MKPKFMSAKIRLVLLQTETSVVDLNVWNVTQAEGVFSHTSSCASVLSRGFSRTSDDVHEKKSFFSLIAEVFLTGNGRNPRWLDLGYSDTPLILFKTVQLM